LKEKERADLLLVERGLAPSRAKAQALILAGRVFVGERRVEKSGDTLDRKSELLLRQTDRFVSRGGDKLQGALDTLGIRVDDFTCVDIGASTGGFTDCLLQANAKRVYAVDVGHGQLAQSLRNDERVVVMERTNARDLGSSSFPEPIQLVVVDASFIGLGKLLPAIAAILPVDAALVALIKPQFEVGKDAARRTKGVIKDPEMREKAIDQVRHEIRANGFSILGECDSTVAGPKGNVEHFVHAVRIQGGS
jgi:23S rRNA (cytidine1920-2'-O)/16S rRNA (cytidine1409-2'-O)-methyltransferase